MKILYPPNDHIEKLEAQLLEARAIIKDVYHDLCCGDPPDAMGSIERYAARYNITLPDRRYQ